MGTGISAIGIGPDGAVSATNSSTATLGALATFTGRWEDVSRYTAIKVMVFADVDGVLLFDLSTDGVNVDRTKVLNITGGATAQVHTLLVVSQFFRVRYTNLTAPQTAFRLQTLFHNASERTLTSGTRQTLLDTDDTTLVRSVSDAILDRNAGLIAYQQTVQKFGENDNVGNGAFEDIWPGGGIYPFQTAATALRIRAGGNPQDDSTLGGATGALAVVVEGLDTNFNEITETIATLGALASLPTVALFRRVNRAYVTDVGTYGGANVGPIEIETAPGAILQAVIVAAKGQTQQAIYTVPAGKTGFITRLRWFVEGNKDATVELYQRQNASDVVTPFTGRRLLSRISALVGAESIALDSYMALPAGTDVFGRAIGSAAGGTAVDCSFDLALVEN